LKALVTFDDHKILFTMVEGDIDEIEYLTWDPWHFKSKVHRERHSLPDYHNTDEWPSIIHGSDQVSRFDMTGPDGTVYGNYSVMNYVADDGRHWAAYVVWQVFDGIYRARFLHVSTKLNERHFDDIINFKDHFNNPWQASLLSTGDGNYLKWQAKRLYPA
jgi:hypothetical protein